MRGFRRAAIVYSALVCLSLTGCDAPAPSEWRPGWADDPFGGVPEDFQLEVTIRTGRDYPERAVAHRRPGRWVLLPDGSLHYDDRVLRDGDRRPGLVRRLTRDQVAHLWAVAQRLGLADPDADERIGNPEMKRPGRDEMMYTFELWAGDESWSLMRRAAADAEIDPATEEFVRTLAALAWATDLPQPRLRSPYLPRRYDFGPDPYSPYRQSEPGGESDETGDTDESD